MWRSALRRNGANANLTGSGCAIVGVGATTYGKTPGRSSFALNAEAIIAAVADAGLSKQDIDGVLCKFPTSGFSNLYKVVPLLELLPTARAYAQRLCERPPLTVQAIKELAVHSPTAADELGGPGRPARQARR